MTRYFEGSPEKRAQDHFTEWFLYFRRLFHERGGKSDTVFGDKLGVTKSYVSMIASKSRKVGFPVALRMAELYGRTLDELAFSSPETAERPKVPTSQTSASPPLAPARRRRGGGASS